MKNLPVSFSEEASADLDRIFDYILFVSSNPQTALNYSERLIGFCERIGRTPRAGLPIRLGGRDLRRRVFERSIIVIYEIGDGGVQIVSILSGRLEPKEHG